MSTSKSQTPLVAPALRSLTRSKPALAFSALIAASATLGACSTSLPSSVGHAPVLSVAAGTFPIAQAVGLIGGAKVKVINVVPAGDDPLTYKLTSSRRATLRDASLLVSPGEGLVPAVSSVAGGSSQSSLLVAPALGSSDPYFWLDPTLMNESVSLIAKAMEKADPAAAPLFVQNAISLSAEVSSLDGDFARTLSACPGKVLVSADDAFSSMAAQYGFVAKAAGPDPNRPQIDALVRAVRESNPGAVVTEPWVSNAGARAVATVAHVTLHSIDTLVGPPPGGWPKGATYFALMEQDLGTLSSALGCNNSEQ